MKNFRDQFWNFFFRFFVHSTIELWLRGSSVWRPLKFFSKRSTNAQKKLHPGHTQSLFSRRLLNTSSFFLKKIRNFSTDLVDFSSSSSSWSRIHSWESTTTTLITQTPRSSIWCCESTSTQTLVTVCQLKSKRTTTQCSEISSKKRTKYDFWPRSKITES